MAYNIKYYRNEVVVGNTRLDSSLKLAKTKGLNLMWRYQVERIEILDEEDEIVFRHAAKI